MTTIEQILTQIDATLDNVTSHPAAAASYYEKLGRQVCWIRQESIAYTRSGRARGRATARKTQRANTKTPTRGRRATGGHE